MKSKEKELKELSVELKKYHGIKVQIAKDAKVSEYHLRKVLAGIAVDAHVLKVAARHLRQAKQTVQSAFEDVRQAVAA